MTVTGALTAAAVSVVTAALPFVIGLVVTFLKSKLTARQFSFLAQSAAEAVRAAEETGAAKGQTGPEKLAQASGFLVSLAKRAGVSITQGEAEGLVHSALYNSRLDMFNQYGPSPFAQVPGPVPNYPDPTPTLETPTEAEPVGPTPVMVSVPPFVPELAQAGAAVSQPSGTES